MKGHGKKIESHGAVLLVSIGTTQAEGRAVIDSCVKRIQTSYPKAEVAYSFTSEPVRLVLREQNEYIQGPLAAITSLLDKGHSQVVVQPLFITSGARYHELYPIVTALNELAGAHGAVGFDGILISSSLLMNPEDYADTAKAIESIYSPKEKDEAVVLVSPTAEGGAEPALCQLQMILDDISHSGQIIIGTVNGYPDFEKVKTRLSHIGAKKVKLVPLTIVPGIHAWIELSGDANNQSWQKQLESIGCTVTVETKGLGEYDLVIELFMNRLKRTADSHSFLK
ncbi:MAG: cobalt chelatase [Methanomicrobiales archaeon]|nr:cobalt chelatase [Methanomicrobiales archaeon]